jgi:hypothetical protein
MREPQYFITHEVDTNSRKLADMWQIADSDTISYCNSRRHTYGTRHIGGSSNRHNRNIPFALQICGYTLQLRPSATVLCGPVGRTRHFGRDLLFLGDHIAYNRLPRLPSKH